MHCDLDEDSFSFDVRICTAHWRRPASIWTNPVFKRAETQQRGGALAMVIRLGGREWSWPPWKYHFTMVVNPGPGNRRISRSLRCAVTVPAQSAAFPSNMNISLCADQTRGSGLYVPANQSHSIFTRSLGQKERLRAACSVMNMGSGIPHHSPCNCQTGNTSLRPDTVVRRALVLRSRLYCAGACAGAAAYNKTQSCSFASLHEF